jgi:nucleotide-binding universal stress UspA family protein
MYRKILVAHDGSDSAGQALIHALDLARLAGAELHMISIEEMPYVPASIDELVEEDREERHRFARIISRASALASQYGVRLHPHVRPGHPVQDIINYIVEHGFDLLVVGFHGHSGFYDRLIGGTADRLVRLSSCPVLVVKAAAPDKPAHKTTA